MSYTAKDLRNICLLGHGGDGKTALAESMLYFTKGTDRLGKNADGNTVSDFDTEEIKRGYSISTSVIPVEYKGTKINVLDNPGYFDFAGEVAQSLRVVDAGLILCTAKSGIEVGTEKAWKYLRDANLPALFYVSKLDEEHADYFATVDALREKFGLGVIPFVYPAGDGVACVLDQADSQGEEYYAMLTEAVAETSEELMEKFFMEEPFTAEEMKEGLRNGIRDRVIMPVFCGCAMNALGTEALIQGIVDYCPNPLEGKPMPALAEDGSETDYVFSHGLHLQDRQRPVRQELLLQGHFRRADRLSDPGQQPDRRQRKAQQHVLPQGQDPEQGLQHRLRRHRCVHQAVQRQDRGHPGHRRQDRQHRPHRL